MSILLEAMRSFGVMPMADGGILGDGRGGSSSVDVGGIHVHGEGLTYPEVLSLLREELRQVFGSAFGGG